MRSIDRLREYVKDAPALSMGEMARAIVAGMADEIERDERSLRGFAERLEAAASERADVTLFGVDYMPNPLDADGKPIHVGDVMENIVCPPVHREVTGVGVECFYGWDDGNGRYSQFGANCYRHHHAPTVEDVLREFGKRWDDPAHYAKGELIEEYAAKLRLAEGEDA